MTPDEFRAHLDRLGYSQIEFAKAVRANDRTVRRWALGEVDVPYAIQMLLEGKKLPRRVK